MNRELRTLMMHAMAPYAYVWEVDDELVPVPRWMVEGGEE